MAIGKPRGNKRSSVGSYSSTVTTLVLLTVCVFVVWILSSNSITSPSNTSFDYSSFFKSNRKIPIGTTNVDHLINNNNNDNDNTSVYERNHSDLRIDVAPQDDETGQNHNNKLDDDRDWLAAIKTKPKQETTNNVDEDDADSLNDSDAGKQEAEQEQDIEISTSDIEDNTDGSTSVEEQKHKTQKIEATDDQESDLEETTDVEHKKGTEADEGPIESHSIATETQAHVKKQEANKIEEPMVRVEEGDVNGDIIDTYKWGLCNVTETDGADYVPCLDNGIKRQCPDEPPLCLVPLPKDYKTPIPWPQSRDKIWLHNMPNKALSDFKGNQTWMKVIGELFITFIKGDLHYSNFLKQVVPEIAWGKRTRVVLDVGCGVANFGGYLFDKEVLTMSFASKDDQESQVQFALERGIPAISAVMGIQRLPFPSRVFDLVHCVRCKVPWHKDGGILLLEINRLLRPGGYFVWSATPVYGTLEEDVQAWKEMSALTEAMCWSVVTVKKGKPNAMGVAIYHKPASNKCYDVVKKHQPPLCKPDDDPNFAWYVPLQRCVHMVPMGEMERGSHWPEEWPVRVQKPPYWLNKTQMGIYGKPAPEDFTQDYEHWKQVIAKIYMNNLGIDWSNVRNVMDMRAVYGGFAAALKDLKVWVLNVVNIDSSHDTLPAIFERGLFGIYHDWCESFSTYPRTYDLLHADHLFSTVKERCRIKGVIVETDRILRPGGFLIARDEPNTITELVKLLRSLKWEVNLTVINKQEAMITGRKSLWRPNTYMK